MMIYRSGYYRLLFLLLILLSWLDGLAQEINKEVYVVRPYEPTLSDASKYAFMPQSDENEVTIPSFTYSITPRRLESGFELDPIKPAKLISTSLPKIYNSWLKLGFGNYSTPLAEFNISNLRSRDYAYGAYLYHKSSHGNIRLLNDQKVPAGYAVNQVNLYGKRFYSNATLTGNLRLDHHGFNYYGYNTGLDTVPDMDRESTRQRTYLMGFDGGLVSTHTDSAHLNYSFRGTYEYFLDREKNTESRLNINTGANKIFNGLQVGLDLSIDNYRLNTVEDTSVNTVFRMNPWISKRSKDWKFVLGFQVVSDIADISRFYFYPRASLDIVVVENVLVPYLGLTGELQNSNYAQLSSENPFIVPGLKLENSSTNIHVYGGIKGNISEFLRFRIDVSYKVIKNMHFFVNDTLLDLQNQFRAEYDDIDLITYHGQLAVKPSEHFELLLNGTYFDYRMFALKKPWHKPEYEAGLNTRYTWKDKLQFNAGLLITGTRYVRDYLEPEGMRKLKPVADVNLKVNYMYSKVFSLFVDFYNIADRSYLIWNQYPGQRFNFMMGLTYKL
jgi:hypothetical protein